MFAGKGAVGGGGGLSLAPGRLHARSERFCVNEVCRFSSELPTRSAVCVSVS